MATKKKSGIGCLPVGCMILIAAPILIVALAKLVDTPAAKLERDREQQSRDLSHKMVLASLKYPLDAELGSTTSGEEKGRWYVSGTVKAKNGFGGIHTMAWHSQVEFQKNRPVVTSLIVGKDVILPVKAKKK